VSGVAPCLSLALVLFSTTRLMRLSIFCERAISGEVRVSKDLQITWFSHYKGTVDIVVCGFFNESALSSVGDLDPPPFIIKQK
jgi:hypothetical protein